MLIPNNTVKNGILNRQSFEPIIETIIKGNTSQYPKKHFEYINNYFSEYTYKCHLFKQYAGQKDRELDIADPVGMDIVEYTKTCHELAKLTQQSMARISASITK